jgi:WD40 repeat protein
MMKNTILCAVLWLLCFRVNQAQSEVNFGNYVEWSPVGNYLAVATGYAASQQSITIYDANTLAVVNQLLLSSRSETLKWNRIGTQIAFSTLDREIIVWNNPITSQETIEFQNIYSNETEPIYPPTNFAWSPNNSKLAGLDGGGIFIWDTTLGTITNLILGDWSQLNGIAWSNVGNKLAVTARDGKIIVLNGETLAVEKTFYLTPDKIQSFLGIDFNSLGTELVSSRARDVMYIWKFSETQEAFSFNDFDFIQVISDRKPFDSYISFIDWSPNDLIIASSDIDGSVEIRDANNGNLLQTINVGEFGDEIPLSWSPDSTRLAYISQSNFTPSVIVPDIDPSYLIPVTPTLTNIP